MTVEYKEYELLEAQKEFLEVPHNYGLDVALYQGGFGSGKTFSGAYLGIKLCQKYPGIRGLVGAETFPLVRDTTLATYLEHLDELGYVEGKDYWYRKAVQKLIFRNGSEVLFRSFDKPNRIKSLNLGFVEIEEMSDVKESTFKMLLGRLRQAIKPEWREVGFKYRLFGHTNPEPDKGWIYSSFVKNKKPNYRRIIAPTTQNKFLDKAFIDSLKDAYDEEYYNLNVLGNDGDYSSGLVVKGLTHENIRPVAYQSNWDIHITCDFNVDPMSWVLAHKSSEKVYFFDEIVIENTTTKKCVDEFHSRYPDHKGKIIINGDASGDNRSCTSEYTNYIIMKNRLVELGYEDVEIRIKSFNPPIKSRIAAFNAKIANTKGVRCIYIDPKCTWLIYNLENLKYKVGTSKIDLPSFHQIKQSKKLKFLGHIFDAASYLVDFYWPIVMKAAKPKQQEKTLLEKFKSQGK